MPQYLSPGVYVEEVPSAVKPIAGVSTSTAGFIGVVPDSLHIPPTMLRTTSISKAQVDGNKFTFDLNDYPVVTTPPGIYQVMVGNQLAQATLNNDPEARKSEIVFPQYPAPGSVITGSYQYKDEEDNPQNSGQVTISAEQVTGKTATFNLDHSHVTPGPSSNFKVDGIPVRATIQQPSTPADAKGQVVINLAPNDVITANYTVGPVVGKPLTKITSAANQYLLPDYPVVTDANSFTVYAGSGSATPTPVTATLANTLDDQGKPAAIATITGEIPEGATEITADYITFQIFNPTPAADTTGSPGFQGATLCTNFTEYTNAFGDYSLDPGHRQLTHAVYGFFNNGGTRCYVVRLTKEANIDKALAAFELVDEIAMVAAPGLVNPNTRSQIVSHCKNMGDRFAILDGPSVESNLINLTIITTNGGDMPPATDYAAWYFPWVKVFDPVAQKYQSSDYPDGTIQVAPSGHVAGIYARVDNSRGVHKAPANEVVMGALDVTQRISKAQQDGLNPKGVNCIRVLNDNILVWGARTIGGDENLDLKYINVRRTLLFIRKSIEEGTQWVVFEPNDSGLWQKITRNVTAFLTSVWRSGALFGATPQLAFYVKCDAETNPQDSIDAGRVVTEIGVAIVRPAEFIIFRISQWAGTGS